MHYDDDFWSARPAEGYSVCEKCIDDVDIKALIELTADSRQCDFCRRRSGKKAIAAPLDTIVEFMAEAIDREYDRAVNSLGWEGSEGGYLGRHFDSYDLLDNEIGLSLPNDDGRLIEILAECFGDEPWCKRDPYGMRQDQLFMFGWERFCELIKHERRFFFLEKRTNKSTEYPTPSEILKLVSNASLEYGLIKTMPPGTLLYRARQQKHGEVLLTSYDYGPPPIEKATTSNRMSPAGIVMFYASEDRKTAVAEIDHDPHLGISVGTFKVMRQAIILDLTALPDRLGFFERQSDSSSIDRYTLDFLHEFVRSLAAKVERGQREHVDYVPTQVVTEYFRTVVHSKQGSKIDGLRYPSAQREGGRSVVLFANRDDLILKPKEIMSLSRSSTYPILHFNSRSAWLKLVRKSKFRDSC
jgi:hypothetical protein